MVPKSITPSIVIVMALSLASCLKPQAQVTGVDSQDGRNGNIPPPPETPEELTQGLAQLYTSGVYPHISNCGVCHNSASGRPVSPYFRDDDTTAAYTAANSATGSAIDFTTPTNSRLYVRIAGDQHNCDGAIGCEEQGRLVLAGIQQMADFAATSNVGGQLDPTKTTIGYPLNQTPGTSQSPIAAEQTAIIEAETATVDANGGNLMAILPDGTAQGGLALGVPDNSAGDAIDNGIDSPDYADMELHFAEGGSYSLYGRVKTPDAESDTIHIGTLGTGFRTYTRGDAGPAPAEYAWVRLTNQNYSFRAGVNTLTIARGEDGFLLDAIAISNEGNLLNNNNTEITATGSTFSFDISEACGIPNAGVTLSVAIAPRGQGYTLADAVLTVPSGFVVPGFVGADGTTYLNVGNIGLVISNRPYQQNTVFASINGYAKSGETSTIYSGLSIPVVPRAGETFAPTDTLALNIGACTPSATEPTLGQGIDGGGIDPLIPSGPVGLAANQAALDFFNATMAPALTAATCMTCHDQANGDPAHSPDRWYILLQQGSNSAAGAGNAAVNRIISKATNTVTHNGGAICATPAAEPCATVTNWYNTAFP